MKSLTTELVDSGRKQDERGRKITRPEEREALVAAYQTSGLTQRAFAEREGIKYCTFTAWLQGRRRAGLRDSADPKPMRFEELKFGFGSGVGSLEVVLPGGTVIRGRRPSELIELVRALRT